MQRAESHTFWPLCTRLALEFNLDLPNAGRLGQTKREQPSEHCWLCVPDDLGPATKVQASGWATEEDDWLSEPNLQWLVVSDHGDKRRKTETELICRSYVEPETKEADCRSRGMSQRQTHCRSVRCDYWIRSKSLRGSEGKVVQRRYKSQDSRFAKTGHSQAPSIVLASTLATQRAASLTTPSIATCMDSKHDGRGVRGTWRLQCLHLAVKIHPFRNQEVGYHRASSRVVVLAIAALFQVLTYSRFYITASTSDTHRVLKIDRTDPTTLSITEDATTYDSTELDLLLRMVQDGNKSQGGLEKVLEFQSVLSCRNTSRALILVESWDLSNSPPDGISC